MKYFELKKILERYTHFSCEVQREQVIKAMRVACERQEVETKAKLIPAHKPYYEQNNIKTVWQFVYQQPNK